MEKLIEQFLEHLRYERNVSEHTLRNYSSDLEQFVTYLSPDKKQLPEISDIDHLTIREWMASLHGEQKKKSSIARKLAAVSVVKNGLPVPAAKTVTRPFSRWRMARRRM